MRQEVAGQTEPLAELRHGSVGHGQIVRDRQPGRVTESGVNTRSKSDAGAPWIIPHCLS